MRTIKLYLILSTVSLTLALYTPSDDVIELNPNNFNSRMMQSDELWLVEFYAPWCGHCKNLAPEWKRAATALKGIVNIAAVDMDAHSQLGAPYGIQGFPTIKVFGKNKNSPADYNGPRQAQGIVDEALSQLKRLVNERMSGGDRSRGGGGTPPPGDDKDVIELTDSNFEELVMQSEDHWLVEFFAPWCGHCKALAPEWASAATQMKGKVKFGALDATVNTIKSNEYGVRGFPTIKYFAAGKKHSSDVVDFDGGRKASDIITWASQKYEESKPAPPVREITSNTVLKDTCDSSQLCIVAFLPDILDCQSECRNGYITLMQDMSERFKRHSWGYLWAAAGQQSDLEASVDVGGFGYPAMVVVNSRKKVFSRLKGPFSETGLGEFLRSLSFGRGSTEPVRGGDLPEAKKREPWDGKDGVLEEPEDIDLSDVELDPIDTVKKEEL